MTNDTKIEVFKQIERFFYKNILKNIFQNKEGILGNSFSSNLFNDLLIEAISEKCSKKSSENYLGIFKQFRDKIDIDLENKQEGLNASRGNKAYRANSKY